MSNRETGPIQEPPSPPGEPPFDPPSQQQIAEWAWQHEIEPRYEAGEPARDQAEQDYYQRLDTIGAENAEAEEQWWHFNRPPGDHHPAPHDFCAPETGGCAWKSPADNQADLEAWYTLQAQEAQAQAGLDQLDSADPEAGA